MYNLTEKQKEILKWIVQKVREGNLSEEFAFVYLGNGDIRFMGRGIKDVSDHPLLTEGVLSALMASELILVDKNDMGLVHCTLRGNAYKAVDSNFESVTTTKTERLFQLQHLLLAHPEGLIQAEIARRLGVHPSTVMRYITELSIILPIWEDEDRKLGIEQDDYLKSLGLKERPRRIATSLDILISRGESDLLEFKVAACWNTRQKTKDGKMADNIVKAVAGFMNSKMGGMILIGVADDGNIVGLANDYQVADAKNKIVMVMSFF